MCRWHRCVNALGALGSLGALGLLAPLDAPAARSTAPGSLHFTLFPRAMMDGWLTAFATSTVLVAVAEIGDKTQLLSFALAARYRKPWTIVAAILVATLANHALAGSAGVLIAQWLQPRTAAWIVGIGFIAFGVWALVPDKLDEAPKPHGGVFMTTLIAFFIAEMGDKTQLATIGLGARFASLYAVVLGTTFGMMLANVPAVLIGHRLAEKLPLHLLRWIAAALFFITGVLTLMFAPP